MLPQRGFNDTCEHFLLPLRDNIDPIYSIATNLMPRWGTDVKFNRSKINIQTISSLPLISYSFLIEILLFWGYFETAESVLINHGLSY